MVSEYIGQKVSCNKIKELYPNTWIIIDNYDENNDCGTLLAIFNSRTEMRRYLLNIQEDVDRHLEYFPTTEEGEYNFLCQLN